MADDDEFGHIFERNIVTAYKNDNNLKTLLVHSRFQSEELQGTFPCNRSRCYTYPIVTKNDTLSGPFGVISLKGSFNCVSTHVIYAIVCTCCFSVYIGETGRRLGDLVREHLRDIRKNSLTSDVGTHFNFLNHDVNDFSVMVITSVVDCHKRKLTEAKIIQKLGTLQPLGLNREDDSSHKTH